MTRHKGLLRSLGSCRKQNTTGPWAMLEFNTEATDLLRKKDQPFFNKADGRRSAIILKNGCLSLLSA